jgi:hypothetical protein
MRRILIFLEVATIGMVTAYGVLSLWQDYRAGSGPEAVVRSFEIRPLHIPPKGWGI